MKILKTIYPYFYALWLFVTFALFMGLDDIKEAPVVVIIGTGIAYLGSVIGMTYSMIKDKAWK